MALIWNLLVRLFLNHIHIFLDLRMLNNSAPAGGAGSVSTSMLPPSVPSDEQAEQEEIFRLRLQKVKCVCVCMCVSWSCSEVEPNQTKASIHMCLEATVSRCMIISPPLS